MSTMASETALPTFNRPSSVTEKPQAIPQAAMTTEAAMISRIKPKPKSSHEMMITPYNKNGAVPSSTAATARGSATNPLMSAIAPIKSRLERGEHHLFATSEEAVMVKQIQSYHSPDGFELDYDSKYVLNIIEEIILRVSTIIPGVEQKLGLEARLEELEREAISSGFTELRDDLAYPINKISSELICKCHLGGDGRKVAEELFQSLANFSWEAKVVIAFAAFAMQYGEFWLVADLYRKNPLARSVGLLMEIPEIMGSSEAFRAKFKAITDLVNAMLDVTKSLFEFNDMLFRHHIAPDAEEKLAANALFPIAAYWTVRSIVACTSILMNLMAMGHEYMSTAMEAWELGSLAHKLAQIKDQLREQKEAYWLKIVDKMQYEAYLALKRLFEVPHLDNMKILRALIYAKDDQLPLYDGTLNTKTSLEVLRKKNVVLLISGLDIPAQEFDILLQLYSESKDPSIFHEHRFELVWLPVIDRSIPLTNDIIRRYQDVQLKMPWYSVAHPSLIDPVVIRFIREEWRFEHKPMLVVLDPQGKVTNYNAINMYWIWGSRAFPFTEMREEALWREASWNMELLVDSIDPAVYNWLQTDKFICVFGGGDIDWIRRFTATAKNIASQLQIPLELLYVGKATMKERVQRNNDIIRRENLSYILPEFHMWFFWVRLSCMWNSREKQGMSADFDEKMNQIINILTYDSSDLEWAVIGMGREGPTASKRGDIMLKCLEDFNTWRSRVTETRIFVNILNEQLQDLHPEFHCSRLFYPGTAARAPRAISCPECGKDMDKHLMYRCCTD